MRDNYYILSYGSLRKGAYNFEYFNQKYDLKYVETLEIKGYDLYSLGPYPAIIKGKNKLTVDLLRCDRDTRILIDGMEHGAGYHSREMMVFSEVLQESVYVILYVYGGELEGLQKVENGDWIKYLQDVNKNKEKEENYQL